ncbi:chorismate mutase [Candidatus Gracilibacteria bacterium]|nr:chorismate mutase [Candidatus Gracilibacteria bacterium]
MLTKFRKEIDEIDHEILRLFAKRLEVVREIGKYKKENNIKIIQGTRWQQLLQDRKSFGKNLGIKEDFIAEVWSSIHEFAVKEQVDLYPNEIEM